MSNIRALQLAFSIALIVTALLLVLAHWFPSMRGVTWSERELTVALIFAVLAIAVRML